MKDAKPARMVEFDSRAVALAWTAARRWERSVGEVTPGVWEKAGETSRTMSRSPAKTSLRLRFINAVNREMIL